MTNFKLNKTATFKTNEDLYYDFSLKCRLNKQKIGDRLNDLISADLKASAPLYVVPEPVLFEDVETPAETGGADAQA